MKKKKDLIIVIVFISFLFLPNILYWFLKDKMDNVNYENRNLYSKPELTFKNITSFPRDFENYYNDNLAFKNEIRKIRSNVYYNLFNLSTTPDVIIGEDGWLFFTGDSTLDDYRKNKYYSYEQKEKIKEFLLHVSDVLKKEKIDFYIFIAPNKETVYSEKLTSILNRTNNNYSQIEDLINYLENNTSLKIIYPKNILIDNKKIYNTYRKYDTHWNDYGAYLGAMEFMKKYDNKFEVPDVQISSVLLNGDLAKMNIMNKVVSEEPLIDGYLTNINVDCVVDTEFKQCKSDKPLYDKNILIVGDSFRNGMIPYIEKLFKNSIFIHIGYYSEDLILKNDIDIVVYETVERYSYMLDKISVLIDKMS